ncbi:MAG: phosphoribosylamine--glycine ligase [Ignavibacteriales bacterium]|nr:phosphoribosylamine--glycine ligase [Ignavibacteriales bacterium]
MKILVIGSGGREHALIWKIRQSPGIEKIFCAPGNAGISSMAENVPIKADDLDALLKFSIENKIDLTVVGSEQPLTSGIVDLFEKNGLKIFGPTASAAELEGSKVFAKHFMKKYRIPTAEFRSFTISEQYDAQRYINEIPTPVVVKADGLAAGKGVAVCDTKEDALESLDIMFNQKLFGVAGNQVVVEEYLEGEEASVFAICDGKNFVLLPTAQDHKRIFDGDKGKNTGGMGAYSPAPIMTDELISEVRNKIIAPTLRGMALEGREYKGCLYIGLMITQTGPKVIEFNCRFGDPETQVVLPLLGNDLVDLIIDSIEGKLGQSKVRFLDKSAVTVVIASGGYPDDYQTDKTIFGLDQVSTMKNVIVFHAGTKYTKDKIVTSGGRVLGVTALGNTLEETIDRAYSAVGKITFDSAYYRSDIGKKGLDRLKNISF